MKTKILILFTILLALAPSEFFAKSGAGFSIQPATTASGGLTYTFAWDYAKEASDQITNYNFYEVINATNTLVASVPISANRTFILDGANVSRGSHAYVVTAVNDAGESAPSNQCTIQKKSPPSGSPTNLQVTTN